MKKLISLISIFLLTFILFGCAGQTEVVTPTPPPVIEPDDPENPDNPDVPVDEEIVYTVTIHRPNIEQPEKPTTNINVIWYNSTEEYKSPIDKETGIATSKGLNLDGEFNVMLDIEEYVYRNNTYTYNPNIYKVNEDTPNIKIQLIRLASYSKSGVNSYGECIIVTSTAVNNGHAYKATITGTAPVYFMLDTTLTGTYYFETLSSTHDDLVNPTVYVAPGSGSYQNWDGAVMYDTGGAFISGRFTKNAKWEYNLGDSGVSDSGGGNVACAFSIYASVKTGSYPVNVYFIPTRAGDYEEPEGLPRTNVYAQNISAGAKIICADREFRISADLNTVTDLSTSIAYTRVSSTSSDGIVIPNKAWHGVFTSSSSQSIFINGNGIYQGRNATGQKYEVKSIETDRAKDVTGTIVHSNESFHLRNTSYGLNVKDGYYHKLDANGNPNGEVLYVDLMNGLEFLSGSSIYAANDEGPGLLVSKGTYVLNYEFLIIGTKFNSYPTDCTNKICYSELCNSDGMYPVTEDLKNFLQDFAIQHSLFFDNVKDANGEFIGTCEANGLISDQYSQWLFACYYYEGYYGNI